MKRSMVLLLALLSTSQARAEERSFVMINGTSFTILEVTLSASDLDKWSVDTLPAPPLASGVTRQVVVPAPVFTCNVDLEVVFEENGSEPRWQYLNLCTLQKIRLRYDPYSGVSTASYEE